MRQKCWRDRCFDNERRRAEIRFRLYFSVDVDSSVCALSLLEHKKSSTLNPVAATYMRVVICCT